MNVQEIKLNEDKKKVIKAVIERYLVGDRISLNHQARSGWLEVRYISMYIYKTIKNKFKKN